LSSKKLLRCCKVVHYIPTQITGPVENPDDAKDVNNNEQTQCYCTLWIKTQATAQHNRAQSKKDSRQSGPSLMNSNNSW